MLQRFFLHQPHGIDGLPTFNEFMILPPDIDEKAIRRPTAEELCVAIAEAKMDKVLSSLQASAAAIKKGEVQHTLDTALVKAYAAASGVLSDATSGAAPIGEFWILTGDQVAVYEGVIREKPASREENIEFLRSYRGSSVATVAGTVLVDVVRGMKRHHTVNHTRTTFRSDLPDDVITRVIDRGDSLVCCGGFVVDDDELRSFIDAVEPSPEAVTGLDMNAVTSLMQRMMLC